MVAKKSIMFLLTKKLSKEDFAFEFTVQDTRPATEA